MYEHQAHAALRKDSPGSLGRIHQVIACHIIDDAPDSVHLWYKGVDETGQSPEPISPAGGTPPENSSGQPSLGADFRGTPK